MHNIDAQHKDRRKENTPPYLAPQSVTPVAPIVSQAVFNVEKQSLIDNDVSHSSNIISS
jgi:hypothetical protein